MHKRAMALSRSMGLACAAAAIALAPGIVHALGLGKLTVYSALNEPLHAEIPLTSVSDRELKTLTASLSTPREFNAAGLDPLPLFTGINIELIQHAKEGYSLALRSKHALREPFLRILVQVEWAGGRLIREFTALINPATLLANDPNAPRTARHRTTPRSLTALPKQLSRTTEGSAQTAQSSGITDDAVEATRTNTVSRPASTSVPARKVAKRASSDNVHAPKTSSKEKEFAERIRVLESQIKTLNGLLELKTKTLTQAPPSQQSRDTRAADVDSAGTPARSQSATIESTAQPSTRVQTTSKPQTQPRKQVSPTEASQAASSGFNFRWLLMFVVALAGGLVVIAGGAMVFIYLRRQQEAYVGASGKDSTNDQQSEPVLQDRRSGRGRRHHFVPVPFERRRGPRRSRDHISGEVGHLHTERADTVEETETYLACGHHEHAEKVLKEAIASAPDRHALKVKLLALYQQHADGAEFENLANQLYAALEAGEPLEHEEASESHANTGPGERPEDGADRYDGKDMAERDLNMHDREAEVSEIRPSPQENHDDIGGEPIIDEEIEFLGVDLPRDHTVFERDVEALEMNVPKTDDESTEHILSDLPTDDDNGNSEDDNKQRPTDESNHVFDVDDFADIKQAVARGLDVLESSGAQANKKKGNQTGSSKKTASKADSRSRKGKRKAKGVNARSKDDKQEQWRNPATKIDLAKAYIDMGDAERARNILDEVLENWDQGDGTRG